MNIKKVLYPTDFSDVGRPALSMASSLARLNEAELLIVHAYEPTPPPATIAGAVAAVDNPAMSDRWSELKSVQPAGGPCNHTHHLLQGRPADAISEFAAAQGVDLIVMGSHGRTGISRALMGSVAESVVRHAPCAVMTLKPGGDVSKPLMVQRILFPTDLSDESAAAFPAAAEIASSLSAELSLLHIDETPTAYGGGEMYYAAGEPTVEDREQQLMRLVPPAGMNCTRSVQTGKPSEKIVEFAGEHDIDLVVMATHARTGVARAALGSVAESVVRHLSIPVVTITQDAAERLTGHESSASSVEN